MSRNINKILIVTDSIANPRSFPEDYAVNLEETYPYLLREYYEEAVFWQLSFGNILTSELIDQAIGYLSNWEPDYIIIHSGINDCRPESISNKEKNIIKKLSGPFFSRIQSLIYNPKLIKYRTIYRATPKEYSRALTKFKNIFSKSKFVCIEISADIDYENKRPGVIKRITEFNKIIRELFNERAVSMQEKLELNNAFNPDCIHINKVGHKLIFDEIVNVIKNE